MNKLSGWMAIDKPEGCSSAGCLNKLKKILSIKKLGHTGTLDPFASGVLCVAIGEATKAIQFISPDYYKEYEFIINFGAQTDTLDTEGEVIKQSDHVPSKKELEEVIRQFTGEIKQIPPKYSALKVEGKRAYELAREGAEFELKSRIVEIKHLELLSLDDNNAKFRVLCSKGTYVRTLGADIAESVGSCGHLIYLRRTKDLMFGEKNIISLAFLEKTVHNAPEKSEDWIKSNLQNYFHPIDFVLDDIPAISIDDEAQLALLQGKKIKIESDNSFELVRAKNKEKLIAVCKSETDGLQPIRVFNI